MSSRHRVSGRTLLAQILRPPDGYDPPLFESAFPNSRKVYVERGELRVPMREIALGVGEPPLRVYDASGPQGADVRDGLPPLRRPWIVGRDDVIEAPRVHPSPDPGMDRPGFHARTATALRGRGTVTQRHYARIGIVTPEMEFIAAREGLEPEFVRAEVARRAIIPANINHPEFEPMVIGRHFAVKVNANTLDENERAAPVPPEAPV